MQETLARFLGQEVPWRRDRLPTPAFFGFPCGSDGIDSPCNVGDLGSIPELGRSPWGEHDNPFQYSCLKNPHGQRSLVDYSPWGSKESDITEQLSTPHTPYIGGEEVRTYESLCVISILSGSCTKLTALTKLQIALTISGGWSVLI